MKRAIIGCFLTLSGMIGLSTIHTIAVPMNGGRRFHSLIEFYNSLESLYAIPLFFLAIIFLVSGIVFIFMECDKC